MVNCQFPITKNLSQHWLVNFKIQYYIFRQATWNWQYCILLSPLSWFHVTTGPSSIPLRILVPPFHRCWRTTMLDYFKAIWRSTTQWNTTWKCILLQFMAAHMEKDFSTSAHSQQLHNFPSFANSHLEFTSWNLCGDLWTSPVHSVILMLSQLDTVNHSKTTWNAMNDSRLLSKTQYTTVYYSESMYLNIG